MISRFIHSKIKKGALTLLSLLIISGGIHAQDCSTAADNVLCADGSSQGITEENSPFSYGCMDVDQSSVYSFQTNSIAATTSMSVNISNQGCNTFLGSDSIYVMIVELVNDADPCDPSNYSNPICLGAKLENFSLQLSGLLNNQDYLLIVGSNHDTNYGPCPFSVTLSGDAISLNASVVPFRIYLGEPAVLTVEGQDPNSELTWQPADFVSNSNSSNPTAYPDETTTFTVTGYVGDCQIADMVTVVVDPPLEIFNTFTPNGDGINDTWKIGRIEKFSNCQIQVYDRWGQLIFKSIGYSQPWDGTNKGKSLPMAAYYYVIELNSLDVKIPPITGVISIVH